MLSVVNLIQLTIWRLQYVKKLLNTLTEVMQNFEERRLMCKHNIRHLSDGFFK